MAGEYMNFLVTNELNKKPKNINISDDFCGLYSDLSNSSDHYRLRLLKFLF